MENIGASHLIELTADIVAAYVAKNTLPTGELPQLLKDVHWTLQQLAGTAVIAPLEERKPAVPAKKSVFDDYIVCLEDGKKFKSLRRHLRSQFNMSPEEYREKWNLPPDYPMVSPNYARARSRLAKEMGLGQQRQQNRLRSD